MVGYLYSKYAAHDSDSDNSTGSNQKSEHMIDADYVIEQELDGTNLEESLSLEIIEAPKFTAINDPPKLNPKSKKTRSTKTITTTKIQICKRAPEVEDKPMPEPKSRITSRCGTMNTICTLKESPGIVKVEKPAVKKRRRRTEAELMMRDHLIYRGMFDYELHED
jgi:hypothetical protein